MLRRASCRFARHCLLLCWSYPARQRGPTTSFSAPRRAATRLLLFVSSPINTHAMQARMLSRVHHH